MPGFLDVDRQDGLAKRHMIRKVTAAKTGLFPSVCFVADDADAEMHFGRMHRQRGSNGIKPGRNGRKLDEE